MRVVAFACLYEQASVRVTGAQYCLPPKPVIELPSYQSEMIGGSISQTSQLYFSRIVLLQHWARDGGCVENAEIVQLLWRNCSLKLETRSGGGSSSVFFVTLTRSRTSIVMSMGKGVESGSWLKCHRVLLFLVNLSRFFWINVSPFTEWPYNTF